MRPAGRGRQTKNAGEMVRYRSIVILAVMLAGCGGEGTTAYRILSGQREPTLHDLEAEDPAVRIQAILWAGENQVKAAVPLLVDRLEEQDPAVRFYAIQALRRITGTDRGYDYKADPAQRRAAVNRWRAALGQVVGFGGET